MSRAFTESTVEAAALAWRESIGWRIAHGPDVVPPEFRERRGLKPGRVQV